MCDYSLQAVKSRAARVGDKLKTHRFGYGTQGFADVNADEPIAICLLPGTEIAIEPAVVETTSKGWFEKVMDKVAPRVDAPAHSVAIFRQIDKEVPNTHHDMLEFADGSSTLVHRLPDDIRATVLQLPAAPKNEAEVAEQRRAEFV